ncbi:hypothetical protein SDC9_18888 [bioreactor metagenome]|uniref:Uncharacterized protein n=1 Tax=bioreactor metagenome TaxID=1076179 RepID=A0A644U1H1_9ZZZZ
MAGVAVAERGQDLVADGAGDVGKVIDTLVRAEDVERLRHFAQMADVDGDQVHRDPADERAGHVAMPQRRRRAERAHQPVGIAARDGGDARVFLGGPGVRIAHGLARLHVAHLDHRQRQGDDRPRRLEGHSTIQRDARAGDVEVVVAAKEDAAGGRERTRHVHPCGHLAEGVELIAVHLMRGFVRAGEVAHDQLRMRAEHDRRHGLPFGGLEAEPVHPGVELDAEGGARQRLEMPRHLVERIQHRRQAEVTDHLGVARHVAGEDEDLGAFAQGLAHRGAFLGAGDEELAASRPRQHPRDARGAEAIAVCLDHGARLGRRARERVHRAPVRKDGIEVDAKGCGSHGGFLEPWAAKVKGNRTRIPRDDGTVAGGAAQAAPFRASGRIARALARAISPAVARHSGSPPA